MIASQIYIMYIVLRYNRQGKMLAEESLDQISSADVSSLINPGQRDAMANFLAMVSLIGSTACWEYKKCIKNKSVLS